MTAGRELPAGGVAVAFAAPWLDASAGALTVEGLLLLGLASPWRAVPLLH